MKKLLLTLAFCLFNIVCIFARTIVYESEAFCKGVDTAYGVEFSKWESNSDYNISMIYDGYSLKKFILSTGSETIDVFTVEDENSSSDPKSSRKAYLVQSEALSKGAWIGLEKDTKGNLHFYIHYPEDVIGFILRYVTTII